MKIIPSALALNRGNALLTVMVFASVSIAILAGAMQWTANNTALTARNNQYYNTLAAAESTTEKVMASILRDFQEQGANVLTTNKSKYTVLVPTAGETAYWSDFEFTDAMGNTNRAYVSAPTNMVYGLANGRFQGLYGDQATYRVISNARQKANTAYENINVGVGQEFQVISIPVFQFAIFDSMNMEINPGDDMTVTGRVHGNTNIYLQPNGCTLTLGGDITAVGGILLAKHPDDVSSRNPGTVTYLKAHASRATPLFLPVGANNAPDTVYQITQPPPAGGDTDPDTAAQRYYNKADLVILVSDNMVKATSGKANGFATTVGTNEWSQFLSTNATFYDYREGKTVITSELDVGKLFAWAGKATNSLGGTTVDTIYIGDFRTESSSILSGIRVKNGKTIPQTGLTIATPNPLYVWGHYNAPYTTGADATNTLKAWTNGVIAPCAFVADAVTILSSDWQSSYGQSTGFGSRTAADTTVNAAIFAGVVPTVPGHYSGGMENFLRLLENWDGKTLTYNGSMVVMYDSRKASAYWRYGSPIYTKAIRNWTFDLNYVYHDRLPPGTPEFRQLVRNRWVVLSPNSTDFPAN